MKLEPREYPFNGLWLHKSEADVIAAHYGWTEGVEYKLIEQIPLHGLKQQGQNRRG